MTEKVRIGLINAAIAAIQCDDPDTTIDEAFALACGWKCGGDDFAQCEWSDGSRISHHVPNYCHDFQAVLDEIPDGLVPWVTPRYSLPPKTKFLWYTVVLCYKFREDNIPDTVIRSSYAYNASLNRAVMLSILRAKKGK